MRSLGPNDLNSCLPIKEFLLRNVDHAGGLGFQSSEGKSILRDSNVHGSSGRILRKRAPKIHCNPNGTCGFASRSVNGNSAPGLVVTLRYRACFVSRIFEEGNVRLAASAVALGLPVAAGRGIAE